MKPEQKAVLAQLETQLKALYETRLTDQGLAFLLTDVGLHKSSVKGEFIFLEEDCGTEVPSGILQIYFTIAEYHLKDYARLAMRLLELNGKVNLGNFNLCDDPMHLYYRYTLPLLDLNDQDACVALVFTALTKLVTNLDYLYNYLTIIVDDLDAYTLDEYDAQMKDLLDAVAEDPDYIEKLENGTL